ncbi:hypothetical protein [Streptomyces sp. cg2]|uniref:hypothetical protein n=1 Tax=Streptomyces sp. cg2 TaxID=3238799 RepID=UPI0034E29C03
MNGEVVKTVPSNLDAEHLHHLKLLGARATGPPPAPPAVDHVGDLPSHQALEVERTVDSNGWIILAGQRVKIGSELANGRITVRLDGHVLHAVHDGLMAKTLPSPFTAGERPRLRGARVAPTRLPPAPTAVSVERKVPTDGVVMVARQRLRVGLTYTGRIVTIYVDDTHFHVACEGAEISLHARKDQHPVTRWKAKIHAPKI